MKPLERPSTKARAYAISVCPATGDLTKMCICAVVRAAWTAGRKDALRQARARKARK